MNYHIVSKCKNKTSTDWNEIHMTIIKNVIDGSLKPLTYICNLSFQTGTFLSKMKIAKIFHYIKLGIHITLQITGPCHYFRTWCWKNFTERLDRFIEKYD